MPTMTAKPTAAALQTGNILAANARFVLPLTEADGVTPAELVGPTDAAILHGSSLATVTDGTFDGVTTRGIAFDGSKSIRFAGRGTNILPADVGGHPEATRNLLIAFSTGTSSFLGQHVCLVDLTGHGSFGVAMDAYLVPHRLTIRRNGYAESINPDLNAILPDNHHFLFYCGHHQGAGEAVNLRWWLWDLDAAAFVTSSSPGSWTISGGVHTVSATLGLGFADMGTGGELPQPADVGGIGSDATKNLNHATIYTVLYDETTGDHLWGPDEDAAALADPWQAFRAEEVAPGAFAATIGSLFIRGGSQLWLS